MAHPGPNKGQYQYGNNGYPHQNRNNIHHNNHNRNKKEETYDTKNFDKIDYIVQIPLIYFPSERQSRFLLAMNYTLPPRSGLGVMDTALEHILHYYDMKKVELIFCEMWQSVCLFVEFHDIPSAQHAYNQLFQFFKTIFYVEDLSNLEEQTQELWICPHCKNYNQFNETFRGRMNSINDMASKRKNAKGDEYIYWCNICRNVNVPSYKKIKYSYQKQRSICSISRVRQHDQQFPSSSVSPPPPHSHYIHQQQQQKQRPHPQPRFNTTQNTKGNYVKPTWQDAKSQPMPTISKESAISAHLNESQSTFMPPDGQYGPVQSYTNKDPSDMKSVDDHEVDGH